MPALKTPDCALMHASGELLSFSVCQQLVKFDCCQNQFTGIVFSVTHLGNVVVNEMNPVIQITRNVLYVPLYKLIISRALLCVHSKPGTDSVL